MPTTARALIAAFDSLAPEEQQEVAAAILHRTILPEMAMDELTAELFRCYDVEEAARAKRCAWRILKAGPSMFRG